MSSLMGGGANKASKISQEQAKSASIRQLASAAAQQTQIDQEKAARPRAQTGRRLLTFLGTSDKLGA